MYREPLSEYQAKQMNALTLAFMGDCVYERFVREKTVLENKTGRVYDIHVENVKFVNCSYQARLLDNIREKLTETEQYMVKRGINSKPKSMPKNLPAEDYKKATGFETLLGFLYFTGNDDRTNEILALCGEIMETENNEKL